MSVRYETALRDCLRDCKAILEADRDGKRYDQYGSWRGQVNSLIRDIGLLLNREDCNVYGYKKEDKLTHRAADVIMGFLEADVWQGDVSPEEARELVNQLRGDGQ